jgi:hypothetical protein
MTTHGSRLDTSSPAEHQATLGSSELLPHSLKSADLHLSIESIPDPLVKAVGKLTEDKPRSFFKDSLAVVTPLATVLISLAVSYSSCKFNERAAVSASSETLSKLITAFERAGQDEATNIQSAMKIAVYGEQALPAVKMVLGSEEPNLRTAGVLVAEQMYRAETVDRSKLVNEMIDHYQSRVLRLGALEWCVKMAQGHLLSQPESRLVLSTLQQSFGPRAQQCAAQEEEVALQAALFLNASFSKDLKDFVLGLAVTCKGDDEHPDKFLGARNQALITLQQNAGLFSAKERESIVADLKKLLPTASDDFKLKLEEAIRGLR